MTKCPACDELLKNPNQCLCGWKKGGKARSFRCAGQGCNNTGSISLSTKGDQWYCRKCFAFLKGIDKPRSKETALHALDHLKKAINITKP